MRGAGYDPSMSSARHLVAILLAAFAFGAAACGNDATEPESGAGGTSTSEAPVEDGSSVDPADGTAAPEGSSYGDTSENEPEGDR